MADEKLSGLVHRRTFLKTAAAAALGTLCSPFLNLSRAASRAPVERAAFTMGSIVTFTVYHDDERAADAAIDEAIREMKSIDTLMSVFNPSSQLSQLNALGARGEVAVDQRIIDVCLRAKEFTSSTEGAFDVTVEPLMELYGFRDDRSTHRFPSDAQLAQTMEAVGMANVEIQASRGTIALGRAGTRLDFGGIAVGYAIDRAVALMKSRGICSGLINHSGDIYAIGSPPEDDRWSIGIRDPEREDGVVATIRIRDQALCTSGNYENFVETDRGTIGHILDPKTGRQASSLLSTTIVAPTAMEADALSTATFVLGEAQARALLAGRDGISGIFVTPGGGAETVVTFR